MSTQTALFAVEEVRHWQCIRVVLGSQYLYFLQFMEVFAIINT